MGVTEFLRSDHEQLRKQLDSLEGAMRVAPEAQFALRRLCFSLTRMLDEHIKREEDVLAPYRDRIQALINNRSSQDRADQSGVLKGINLLLLDGLKAPVGRVVTQLARLVDELREHMNELEREVFPVVNRLAGQHSQAMATL